METNIAVGKRLFSEGLWWVNSGHTDSDLSPAPASHRSSDPDNRRLIARLHVSLGQGHAILHHFDRRAASYLLDAVRQQSRTRFNANISPWKQYNARSSYRFQCA